ncbi:MAG: hypothetical protein L6Q99_07340 [Planctomycetes bacterium]|nr:hypothetical protein [Planctomycetota bacterium]
MYHDIATGKRVIAGTFNLIVGSHFPAFVPMRAAVYISITDIRRGSTNLVLRLVDTSDLGIVMETEAFAVESDDPRQTLEFGVPIPGFSVPHEGSYDLELHADGERIGSLRIAAHALPAEQT